MSDSGSVLDSSPAWLSDPSGRHELRYWTGTQWSEQVADGGTMSVDRSEVLEVERVMPPAQNLGDNLPLFGTGISGRIEVDEHFVTITRKGARAKLAHGFTKGVKRIPIASITSVQFKKTGLMAGYIQFTIPGGNESLKGAVDAASDENSVTFSTSHQKEFETIRDHVEATIVGRSTRGGAAQRAPEMDLSTQLRELAGLRDDGLLTIEEFELQKRRLLG